MPPRLAPKPSKPTLEAEPDLQLDEAHHGTSEPYLPVLGDNPMLPEQVAKAVGVFYWYKFQGRPMTRAEVQGMISFHYGLEKPVNYLDNRFENLEKQITKSGVTEYEKDINKNNPDRVRAEVDVIFNGYCDADKHAKDIRDNLMGLKVRLPPLRLRRPPVWAKESIRIDQLCCLYGLANWCKTDEDRLLSVGLVSEIATRFIFHENSPYKSSLVTISNLREPEHDLASQLHDILESHQDIKSHFRNLALRFYNEHTEREIPDPAEDPLTSTTSGFSAMTVTAGPSREEWSPLHDFDTESASAESSQAKTSPPPKQSTTIDPRHLVKRRERESTGSPSPGSGAGPSKGTKKPQVEDGKGKGKAPDRKRPRGPR